MGNPKGNLATLKSYAPGWNFGQTRTIRVPVALAPQVLEFARALDNGEALSQLNKVEEASKAEVNSPIDSETLSQVIAILNEGLKFPSNNATKTKAKIKEALALVQRYYKQ